MKNKTNHLLLLLPLLPFMMANSPAPAPTTTESYKDVELISISEAKDEDSKYYYYDLVVKNTGTGFVQFLDVYDDEKGYYICSVSSYEFDDIFEETLLGPNVEYSLKTYPSYDKDSIDPTSEFYVRATAFVEFADEVTVEGEKTIEKVGTSRTYRLDIELKNVDYDKYNYAVIAKINYDGQARYLKLNAYNDFEFYTKQGIKLANLSYADEIYVLKSYVYGYKPAHFSLIATLITAGALALCGGVFCIVYFSVKANKKKIKN